MIHEVDRQKTVVQHLLREDKDALKPQPVEERQKNSDQTLTLILELLIGLKYPRVDGYSHVGASNKEKRKM